MNIPEPIRLPKLHKPDQDFASMREQALELLRIYSPEWSTHTLSDPGITLLEAVLWSLSDLHFRTADFQSRNWADIEAWQSQKISAGEVSRGQISGIFSYESLIRKFTEQIPDTASLDQAIQSLESLLRRFEQIAYAASLDQAVQSLLEVWSDIQSLLEVWHVSDEYLTQPVNEDTTRYIIRLLRPWQSNRYYLEFTEVIDDLIEANPALDTIREQLKTRFTGLWDIEIDDMIRRHINQRMNIRESSGSQWIREKLGFNDVETFKRLTYIGNRSSTDLRGSATAPSQSEARATITAVFSASYAFKLTEPQTDALIYIGRSEFLMKMFSSQLDHFIESWQKGGYSQEKRQALSGHLLSLGVWQSEIDELLEKVSAFHLLLWQLDTGHLNDAGYFGEWFEFAAMRESLWPVNLIRSWLVNEQDLPLSPEFFEADMNKTGVWPLHPSQALNTEPVTNEDYQQIALKHESVRFAWVINGQARGHVLGIDWAGNKVTEEDLSRIDAISLIIDPVDERILNATTARQLSFLQGILAHVLGWPSEASELFANPFSVFQDVAALTPRRNMGQAIGAALVSYEDVVFRGRAYLRAGVDEQYIKEEISRVLDEFLTLKPVGGFSFTLMSRFREQSLKFGVMSKGNRRLFSSYCGRIRRR